MSWIPSINQFVKGTVATVAGVSTVGLGLLYYGQGYLIYPSAFPPGSRTDVDVPSTFGLPYEDLNLRTTDNVDIHAFLLVQREHIDRDPPPNDDFPASRPTVIMFHGNAGNHGHRIPLARVFYIKMRCNVLLLSYRGYGLSQGTPSEKGLCIDADTALRYVLSHPALSKTPIVLYGQSIGGAVAIDLASRNPSAIRAIILENTFTSLPQLVPHALPFLSPFSFLCHQKWNSASKIALIPASTPMLLLSGARDEVVPPEHMRALWKLVAKRGEHTTSEDDKGRIGLERARFKEFEKGTHNDTCVQHGYWNEVADFVLESTKA